MQIKLTAAALLGVALMTTSPAAAVTNFTSNFDTQSFASATTTLAAGSTFDGWTVGSNGLEVQKGTFGAAKSSSNVFGGYYVELDTTANSSISRAIDAGKYSISFAYSLRPGAAAATDGIALFLNDTQLRSIAIAGTNRGSTTWATITYNFTAQQAGTLKFAAVGTSDGVGGLLDSVSLVGTALPVPEPGEWAMMVAGLGVIGMAARRRRAL